MPEPGGKTNILDDAAGFRMALRRWFGKHGKDYPWRRTTDPHAILVSEVMLQQTRIATVLGRGYYTGFLERFPDVTALAAADDTTLLKAWEGLGYYRRARMLRDTARAVIERHGGRFPETLEELCDLPGIGAYTAGAVFSFAYNRAAPLVDGNVARVLARLMDFHGPVDAAPGKRQIWEWAERLVDPKHPRIHNSALMELGQTHCRAGAPLCGDCPVSAWCQAREPGRLPNKAAAAKITEVAEYAIWTTNGTKLLLHQESGARRNGLWKLPERKDGEVAGLPLLMTAHYTITRYRVTLHVHACGGENPAARPQQDESWHERSALSALPMPAPYRRAIDGLLQTTRNGV
jgi:A/G-specific adenine glycosylase